MNFVFVALGGAAGAMGRYGISLIPVKAVFPYLTLMTNLIGAVLIGFVAGIAGEHADVGVGTVLFWKTGVCGGFTTFSTFSLEAYELLQDERYLAGGLYIVLSVILCLIGIICGRKAAVLVR